MSSIPFDSLVLVSERFQTLNVIGMLKLVRVARISKIIQHLNVKKEIKTYLKTAQILFYLLLYIHVQA